LHHLARYIPCFRRL